MGLISRVSSRTYRYAGSMLSVLLFHRSVCSSYPQALRILRLDEATCFPLTKAKLKTAYFEQCKVTHPDAVSTSKSRQFSELKDAYDYAVENLIEANQRKSSGTKRNGGSFRRHGKFGPRAEYVHSSENVHWKPGDSYEKWKADTRYRPHGSNYDRTKFGQAPPSTYGQGPGYKKRRVGFRGYDYIDYRRPGAIYDPHKLHAAVYLNFKRVYFGQKLGARK